MKLEDDVFQVFESTNDNLVITTAARNMVMFLVNEKAYFEDKEHTRDEFLNYFEEIYLDLFEADNKFVLEKFNMLYEMMYEHIEENPSEYI